MIKVAIATLGLILASATALANDSPASDASIREVLQITDARNLLEGVKGQMDTTIRSMMQQATQGQQLTPDRQAILDRMKGKFAAAMNETMKWEFFEPLYMRMYKASFTQDEINGLIVFYKTPAGQALVKKMPLVMKNLMAEMPEMMKPMLDKIRVIQRETMQELNALEEAKKEKKSAN